MKHFTYIFALATAVLWLGNSGGRAASARAGNTGAPGDEHQGGQPLTCQFCHFSAGIETSTQIAVLDEGGEAVTAYVPGSRYTVRVSIQALTGAPSGYGFQLIALSDSDNRDLKGFSDPSANTKLSTVASTSRTYAEHRTVSTPNSFEVKWTAPQEGTGTVSFYAAGNGVNRNGDTSGDGGSHTKVTLAEAVASSISEPSWASGVRLYPSPAAERLFVEGLPQSGDWQFRIIDLSGRIYSEGRFQAVTGVDVSALAGGMYLLLCSDAAGSGVSLVRKFVRQ